VLKNGRAWAAAVVLPAVFLAACSTQAPRSAPLVQGVETNHSSQQDTVLRRRLLAAFPLGGPEAALPVYLRGQGFEVRRLEAAGDTGDQVYGEAKLRWGGVLLGRRAWIYWRASKAGALTELGTIVADAGPLAALGEL
jgi:hypothetical protein